MYLFICSSSFLAFLFMHFMYLLLYLIIFRSFSTIWCFSIVVNKGIIKFIYQIILKYIHFCYNPHSFFPLWLLLYLWFLKLSLTVSNLWLLNNKNFQQLNISVFVVRTLYRFQSSFKIGYCTFCFLSLFPYLTSSLRPAVWLPARSFLYLCLLSYPLIFHLLFHGAHFFSFLLQDKVDTF